MKGVKSYVPKEESKTEGESDLPDQEVEADKGPAITFADYENMMI